MEIRPGPDLKYFLWSLVLGFALAVFYDFLRASRKVIKTADIVVNIEDILFIMLSGSIAVAAAYLANNGFFRLYSLASMALSFFIYRFVIKDRLVRLLEMLCCGILQAARFAAKALLLPFKIVVKLIGKPIVITIAAVGKRKKKKRHTAE